MAMKPSKFNIMAQSKDEPGKVLLYNTFRDHRILFDDPKLDPRQLFRKLKAKTPLSAKEAQVVPELKEMGILLDDEVDELRLFENWYHNKIQERTDIMQVTILPAMGCNLACHYCFEKDVRERGLMTPETIAQVIAYLQHRIERIHPKHCHLTYFGGEPLLHPKAIKQISCALWQYCRDSRVNMEIGMITNGVLLTPEFVNEMLPWGFKWIKITFDGDRQEHDKKRVWKSGKGTFDAIYNNLCQIHGKLRIAIGGNFDEQNYGSIFPLLERLKKSPFADDIMVARFKPIMTVNTKLAVQREGKVTSFCEVCSFNKEQVGQILALQEKTLQVGLPIQEEPVIGPCEYHSRHAFTIAQDGTIYNCPAFVGLHNLAAGHVRDDVLNDEGERQLTSKKWDGECETCAYLPNCVGGCRYNAVNRTGSLEVKSCEIDYLVKFTGSYMQREIAAMSEDPPIESDETALPVCVPSAA
jgi:uncharacterized protein